MYAITVFSSERARPRSARNFSTAAYSSEVGHAFQGKAAGHSRGEGYQSIRAGQEGAVLAGSPKKLQTTLIYTHVAGKNILGVTAPWTPDLNRPFRDCPALGL